MQGGPGVNGVDFGSAVSSGSAIRVGSGSAIGLGSGSAIGVGSDVEVCIVTSCALVASCFFGLPLGFRSGCVFRVPCGLDLQFRSLRSIVPPLTFLKILTWLD